VQYQITVWRVAADGERSGEAMSLGATAEALFETHTEGVGGQPTTRRPTALGVRTSERLLLSA
jgi:hypothetical protein